ncbi:MAG: hypothetical protein ACXW0F_11655 [Gaiellaceae bacterium]
MSERFPGCHGVAVAPDALGLELGWLSERPPLAVDVELVDAVDRAPGAERVWQLDEPPGFGLPAITSQTWIEPAGCIWVGNTLNLSLRVDYRRNIVSVAAKDGNLQVVLEALASIALPLVAQQSGSLVLHGSAAAVDGSAVMLCAEGGSGKSSLLMGLVTAGWQALSEDQCVISFEEDGGHRIWPGPNWVRLKQGAPLPPLVAKRSPLFEALDKIAWDLRDDIAHAPAKLERIVLLEPPGGTDVLWEPVSTPEVIGTLASHATWLQRQDDFAQAVLPLLVRLGMSVPGFRMRIPRRPDWTEHGIALLAGR